MAEIKYLDLSGLQRYDQKIKEVVNTGLDSKIGKDDAMLSKTVIGDSVTSSTTLTQNMSTPMLTGEWLVEFDSTGGRRGDYSLFDESGNQIHSFYGDGPYAHMCVYGCNENGDLYTYYKEESDSSYQVLKQNAQNDVFYITLTNDTTSIATITSKEVAQVDINTKDSFIYLEENKVDKTLLAKEISDVNNSFDLVNQQLERKLDEYKDIINLPSTDFSVYTLNNDNLEITDLTGAWAVYVTLDPSEIIDCKIIGSNGQELSYQIQGCEMAKLYYSHYTGRIDILRKTEYGIYNEEISYADPADYRIVFEPTQISNSKYIRVVNNGQLAHVQSVLTYLLERKIDARDLDNILSSYAGKNEFNNAISYINTSLEGKADKTEVALKANKTEVESAISGINATLSTKITAEDLPTAVSQLSNDAGYAVAGDLKIAEVTEGLGENVAKAYKFEGGAESAVIEIPKDQTLKSVELGKIVDDAFVVDPTGEILRFTYIIADGSEKVVDVNVSNLITEAELDPVYDLIDTKLNAADVLTVSNDEIDAMFA